MQTQPNQGSIITRDDTRERKVLLKLLNNQIGGFKNYITSSEAKDNIDLEIGETVNCKRTSFYATNK